MINELEIKPGQIEDVVTLLSDASKKGISIFMEGEKLMLSTAENTTADQTFIDIIKTHKNEIKAFLINTVGSFEAKDNSKGCIVPRDRTEESKIPLSFEQEHLWFIDTVEDAIHYHIPAVFRLNGKLNIEVLEYSFQEIVNRHEGLRTVFKQERGVAYQQVLPKNGWRLSYTDQVINDEKKSLDALVETVVKSRFDLAKDHMLRVVLYRLAEDEYLLVIVVHHIASDEWSLSIFVKELIELYASRAENRTPVLPDLKIQYADYAHWQRQSLNGDALDKKLRYWEEKLKNIAPTDLPADFARPPVQSTRGDKSDLKIDRNLTNKIKALGRQENATLHMLLVSVFNVLLYRYTGQKDISIGTPVTNRTQSEVEPLIGYFVNTLVLRSHLSNDAPFKKLLAQVKSTMLQAYDHQDVPFGQVVNRIEKKRDRSRSPLVQVMVVLHNNQDIPEIKLKDVKVVIEPVEYGVSKFDLTLTVSETADGLDMSFVYCSDLFLPETIARLSNHYKTLLSAVVENPNALIGQLKMLTKAEEHQLLSNLNQAKVNDITNRTVIDLFEEQARLIPESVAVVYESTQLSYTSLDKLSNQLAQYLVTNYHLGIENLAGVKLQRSEWLIVSILAVLKTGSAFVPIELGYPEERIRYIESDSRCRVIITQEIINDFIHKQSEYSSKRFNAGFKPSNLAYVIYTSGTTGRPKGVMVEHRGIYNLTLNQIEFLGLTPLDNVLQFASAAFDAFCSELFTTLGSGAKLFIPAPDMQFSVDNMRHFLVKNNITIATLPPSYQPLLQNDLKSVRTIISAGEALNIKTAEILIQNGTNVVNGYGPTESSVCVTMSANPVIARGKTTIGYPLSNVKIYLLDEDNALVPFGCVGELCVGGVQVARGYLNRVELTKEKFIADPFVQDTNFRIYKTGDLARWLPDGNLEYIGRKDHQVKIRGYRIELGEIESVLTQHEMVRQAVVNVHVDETGNKHLIAYVISEKTFDKNAVNVYLQSSLPQYMVPSVYVELDTMPLTSNGKIDRKALPDPEILTSTASSYTAPRNSTEEQLAEIWSKLLHVDNVSIHHNFFELGGDSIIAIQFVSRAKEHGLIFKVKDVFDHQTIAELSNHIRQYKGVITEQGYLQGGVGFLPIQKQFFKAKYKNSNHFNQSVLLNLNRSIGISELTTCFDLLLARHDALRLRYSQSTDELLVQYYGEYKARADVVDSISDDADSEITSICETYQRGLSILDGQLIRAVFIRTPASYSDNRLFIVIHHLAVDGFSWRIIIEDLITLLENPASATTIELSQKTTSYRQWQTRLQQCAQKNILRSEYNYWKETLKGLGPLPIDKTVEGERIYKNTSFFTSRLSKPLTDALLHRAHHAYNTEITDLLISAFAQTIGNWIGRSEFVFALEGHGREEIFENIDLSKTVGWFTTIFPVRLQFSKNDSVSDLIISVKEQLRSIPNKGIGYGILRYLSNDNEIENALDADFEQIIFNYLGNADAVLSGESHLQWATESPGTNINPENSNPHKISITGVIRDGCLCMTWTYDVNTYHSATLESLSNNFQVHLSGIIEHCISSEHTTKTPSDYGLNGLTNHRELVNFLQSNLPQELEDIYRLSPLQEGLLFHSLYDRSGAYIVQFSCDFADELNVDYFQRAWDEIIVNHSILRTGFFHDVFLESIQCVFKTAQLPLTVLDYTGVEENSLDLALSGFLKADSCKPFDLKYPPLMRITLIKLPGGNMKMVWTNHHILLDGWSQPILMSEFISHYKALRSNLVLPPAKIDRYKDLIVYLRSISKLGTYQYWSTYLSRLEGPALLPFVNPSISRNKQFANHTERFVTDVKLTQGLFDFARQHHLTLNTIVQGAWAYLLSRYTGMEHVVFGSTVSGRFSGISDIEKRVGLYINTIPVCIAISNELNIVAWLFGIQERQISTREYCYTALNEIHALTGIQDELFDSLVVFENYPVEAIATASPDFKVENVASKEQTNYTLTLLCATVNDTFSIDYSYNTSLLPGTAVKMIMSHMEELLRSILDPKNNTIEDLEYMSENDTKGLLASGLNAGGISYPKEKTIHELFRAQAEVCQTKVAVELDDIWLTYKELDERSNQLAWVLREAGVVADSIVGLLADRSIDTVISMLGILKAGGAYMPMDIDYPEERIKYMLANSGARILLTTHENIGIQYSVKTICYKTAIESCINTAPLNNINTPNDICYVIYTSGTTGHPKGVMVEHRNVVRLFFNDAPLFDFNRGDVWTMFHNHYFDFSVWEIYGALLYGGKLIIIPKIVSKDPVKYLNLLANKGVTILNQTPSAFYNLVQADAASEKRSLKLRYVIFGGEALKPAKLKAWYKKYSQIKLINMFGITETTVHVTYKEISGSEIEENISNIGKPIPTLSAFIFDKYLRLVPKGVPGELFVGGEGVSRGYLKNDVLTKERFISNPYNSSERLYRTGDLVRLLDNDDLEYIGRIDNQVKIRGHRIELGEIESQILKYPQLRDTVVTVVEDSEKNRSLCAYCVTEKPFNMNGIRAFISKVLPDYMVPSYFVSMEEIPLTSNGKVDKKKLPQPNIVVDEEYVPPGNEVERRLVAIWSDVLNVDAIGINGNFFTLGGDSIKAIRLINTVNNSLNVKVGIADLFENPSITAFANCVSGSSLSSGDAEVRHEIENEFARKKIVFVSKNSTIKREGVDDVYPASDVQKGMIYHSLAEQGVYHDQMVHFVQYPRSHVTRLDHAVRLMIKKHAILRTGFYHDDDELLQVVFKEAIPDIKYYDISDKLAEEQKTIIENMLILDKGDPFEISEPGLFRLIVFTMGNNSYCICFICHHAIIDGWSDAYFNTELNNILISLDKQPDFTPSALKSSYKDFVVWQHAELRKEESLTYWQEELLNYKRFYFDTVEIKNESRAHDVVLSRQLSKRLKYRAMQTDIHIKHLFFSAFIYSLNMFSYEGDVTVGLVTSNRPAIEDGDKILGCFLNTIPVRFSIPAGGTWKEFVESVDKKLNTLKKFDHVSFSKIVELLNEPSTSQNPITDILFNYTDFHIYEDLQGFKMQTSNNTIPVEAEENDYVAEIGVRNNSLFNLNINKIQEEFFLSLSYSTSFVSKNKIAEFYNYFKWILECIANEPGRLIDKNDILSPAERRQLLVDFNDTHVDYPKDETVLHLINKHVDLTPDAIAVVYEELSLTYAELEKRTNQFANYLVEQGVTPQSLIPVCLERSLDMIIVLIGVMKTGCAYVPIDPAYPNARIHYIIEDIGSFFIIAEDQTMGKLNADTKKVVNINRDRKAISDTRDTFLSKSPASSDLVYIIYTSGTTGNPKGVMIEHRALLNFIHAMIRTFTADQQMKLFSLTTYSFDISGLEFYMPLSVGGKLFIASGDDLADPGVLIDKINTIKPSHIQATPSRWKMLIDSGWKNTTDTTVLSGGEALNLQLKNQLISAAGRFIWNLYGPTETTIWSTVAKLDIDDPITIGKPIDNTKLYILDKHLKLVPIGVDGDLYISGDGLSRGYYKRSTLTSQRFISNPYAVDNHAFIYKTGDIGRWLPSGHLQLSGRADNQVKIRGFRIELGEIENQLLLFPSVKEAAVLTKENEDGKFLVAYFVSNDEIESDELRSHLLNALPDYMVPSYFQRLEKLPLTPNGKIDKKAFPDPEIGLRKGYMPPSNEMEETLVSIWCDVLRINRSAISIDDNFFGLGGNSIKAVHLMNNIQKQLGRKLALRDFFSHASPRELSAWIQDQKQHEDIHIPKVPRQEYYIASSSQERMFYEHLQKKESLAYNISAAYSIEGQLDVLKLKTTLQSLVNRHEALRTSFILTDNGVMQKINDPVDVDLTLLGPTGLEDLESAFSCFIKPFDLSSQTMIRFGLLSFESNKSVLFVDVHHIVCDGISLNILMKDFKAIYECRLVTPLQLSYVDYSSWQRSMTMTLCRQQEYWLKELSGDIPLLELPAQRSKVKTDITSAKVKVLTLEGELYHSIKKLAVSSRVSDFMFFLTSYYILLSKISGNSDIIIGTDVMGRTHSSLKNVVGTFVNILPLRLNINLGKTFYELLIQVKECVLRAFENQDFQFDQMVTMINANSASAQSPVVSVHFAFANYLDNEVEFEIGSLRFKSIHLKRKKTTQYEFKLEVVEEKEKFLVSFIYSRDIYNDKVIDLFVRYYSDIINSVALNSKMIIEGTMI